MKNIKITGAVTLIVTALALLIVVAAAPAAAQSQGAVVITQNYCQIDGGESYGFYTGRGTFRERQGELRASCTAVLAYGSPVGGNVVLPGWASGQNLTCRVIFHKSGRATASCSG